MKAVIKMDQSSLNMTLGFLHKLRGGRKRSTVKRGLNIAGEVLVARIKKNASYRDHTIKDLKRLGSPYAKRHGKISIHTKKSYIVHSRKGKFIDAIRGKYVGSSKSNPYFKVWIDKRYKYPKYIITGTKVMIPRDTLYLTMQERGTKRAMLLAMAKEMGKELRTQVFMRFW
jgi:hypothetical protein